MKTELAKKIITVSSMEQFLDIWAKIRTFSADLTKEDLEVKCWLIGVCDNDEELELEHNLYLAKSVRGQKDVFFPFEGSVFLLKDIYAIKKVKRDFISVDQQDKAFKYIYIVRKCNIKSQY